MQVKNFFLRGYPGRLLGNFFYLQLEQQIVRLVQKIRKKKIINILNLLAQMKTGLARKFPTIVFYHHPSFNPLLQVLKREFYIFDYFIIPTTVVPIFLFSLPVTKCFLQKLVCVVFKPTSSGNNLQSLQNVVFISTKSRTVFISYKQLLKLVSFNTAGIFILNTSLGVFTHRELLQKKIGGSLLCKVY